jgi:hypothetical protein
MHNLDKVCPGFANCKVLQKYKRGFARIPKSLANNSKKTRE